MTKLPIPPLILAGAAVAAIAIDGHNVEQHEKNAVSPPRTIIEGSLQETRPVECTVGNAWKVRYLYDCVGEPNEAPSPN